MTVFVKKDIALPPVSQREVLRYAACHEGERIALPNCPAVSSAVCFAELSVEVTDDTCDFGFFKVRSNGLSKNLAGCRRVLLFAATVGIGFDREIAKFTRLSPSRALLVSAMGTERIEALCDEFVREYEEQKGIKLRPRFSPGYGDLPLDIQREIFALLEPSRKIGVSLGASLLMTPTKSVTAFVGID